MLRLVRHGMFFRCCNFSSFFKLACLGRSCIKKVRDNESLLLSLGYLPSYIVAHLSGTRPSESTAGSAILKDLFHL